MSHLTLTRFSFGCNTKRQRVNGKSVTLHVPDKYCKIASINVCFQLGFLLFVVVRKQGMFLSKVLYRSADILLRPFTKEFLGCVTEDRSRSGNL